MACSGFNGVSQSNLWPLLLFEKSIWKFLVGVKSDKSGQIWQNCRRKCNEKNIVKEKIGQYFNWACFGCKVQQTTETFTGAENDIVAWKLRC